MCAMIPRLRMARIRRSAPSRLPSDMDTPLALAPRPEYTDEPPVRDLCRRCLRPRDLCLCEGLVPAPSRTRVVLLQHPREARLAICSAWLARVALVNAELHAGVRFADHPRVREVLAAPGTALLYP